MDGYLVYSAVVVGEGIAKSRNNQESLLAFPKKFETIIF